MAGDAQRNCTKEEARLELAKLIAAVGEGSFVERTKETVGAFVSARIDQWEAAGTITARTAARYRDLHANQIVPYLGEKALQKLKPLDIETWHTTLRTKGRVDGKGGVAPRTVGHAHRVLSSALTDAVENEVIVKNVCRMKSVPKIEDQEIVIVKDVPDFVAKLQQSERLRAPAMTALFTGMRLGEVLALRWSCVDLDKGVIKVREALEFTKAHGVRVKAPKSKAGRRDITLPDILRDTLREHRKAQLELRMRLGAGRMPDDAFVFADAEGNLCSPNALSLAWRDFADKIGAPEITFHALRHTHASQLIHGGVDVVTISKRLGHTKPDITLRVYSHMFTKDDSKAADAINKAMG